jgi:hypothetical protein
MSTAKHTPTPWAIWTEEKARRDDVYIVGNPTGELGGTRHLAYMVDTWTRQQTTANAAFIVRAVNSHAALVNALKLLTEKVDAAGGGFCGFADELQHARAALAAADAA